MQCDFYYFHCIVPTWNERNFVLRYQRGDIEMAIPEFVNKIVLLLLFSCIISYTVLCLMVFGFGSVQSVSAHVLPWLMMVLFHSLSFSIPLRVCAREIIVGTPMIIDCISHFIINIVIAIRMQRNGSTVSKWAIDRWGIWAKWIRGLVLHALTLRRTQSVGVANHARIRMWLNE